jgi:hypothetical protein
VIDLTFTPFVRIYARLNSNSFQFVKILIGLRLAHRASGSARIAVVISISDEQELFAAAGGFFLLR